MIPQTFLSTESFMSYGDFTEREDCRICLEQVDQKMPPFCECRGNHRNVHQRCLREWAKRAEKFEDGRGNLYFYCDLCRTPIYLSISRYCHLKSTQQISRDCWDNSCKIVIIFILLVFFGVLLGVCINAMLNSSENIGVFVTALIVAGLMVGFTLPMLIFRVFFEMREEIGNFLPPKNIKRSNLVANSYAQTEN